MANTGCVVWFTGLPSSGKTTLANLLAASLKDAEVPHRILDGDEVRLRLTKDLGFSRKDRDENISRISYVAKLLSEVGAIAITAAISPYRQARDAARAETKNFIEVYVRCDVKICIKRDVKGLYAKALDGSIGNFTGVSDPYEEPLHPDVIVETDKESPQQSLAIILDKLRGSGLHPVADAAADRQYASATAIVTKLKTRGYIR